MIPVNKNYKTPELGWSLHMTGGWKTQFDRIRRWYYRACTANTADDRWDFLYAFFENSLHLRDWLEATKAVTKKDLEDFFSRNRDMGLCRDLANSHKHYLLKKPSNPVPPTEVREYTPNYGNFSSDISLVVLSRGKKYDVFDLAKGILNAWEEFIASHISELEKFLNCK